MHGPFWCAMNNRKFLQGLVFFFASLLGFLVVFHFLIPQAQPLLTKKDYKQTQKAKLHYVALGDSLTKGVGDATKQGGFVPLLAQSLTNDYDYQVTYENYGVSGDTSGQILDRLKKEPEISQNIKTADVMTLTVGGNDLRKVILDNILDLQIETFDEPSKAYSERLVAIIQFIRKKNPGLPIYVLGVYNPYYLNFPNLTAMQTIVDNWNTTTKDTVTEFENVYFVPINDLLYQGLKGEKGVEEQAAPSGSSKEKSKTNKVDNNLLYEGDKFHPNNTGYEIMKQAVLEKIHETKNKWKD